MEQLEKKVLEQGQKAHKQEEEIQIIFNALKQLLNTPNAPSKQVGYKSTKDEE